MSDLSSLSNLARLLGLLLPLASLVAWGWISWRRSRGEDPLPQRPREACPWHGAAVALVIPAVHLVSGTALHAMAVADEPSLERVPAVCLALMLQAVAAIGLLALSAPLRRKDFGIDGSHVQADLRTGGLWFLASWALVFAVNQLVYQLGWRAAGVKHPYFKILDGDTSSQTVFWIAASVLVVAPLVEELLYRVILQGWLETRVPARAAIGLVAAVFAAVHSWPDCLPLFALALVLGYVYHRLHSYLAVVTLHALFNATNLGLALLAGDGPSP